MLALIDATGMYASAEKVFDPTIRNKPVIVLSNNDGCIVAMCPIAKRLGKKLGINKFGPYFQVADKARKAGFVVKSSNYELYADISQRMMETCESFGETHIYSIDECFMRFPEEYTKDYLEALGHDLRKTIWRHVRLPVGVGFGPSLTLAKAANHASKKLPGATGVALIATYNDRKHVLSQMACDDVWGVGRRLAKRLDVMGIKNAWQLAEQPAKKIRKDFSILMENTVRELKGEAYYQWDTVRPAKKEIYSTRSFGKRVTCPVELKNALSGHGETASRKMREQNSLCAGMVIFAASSPHDNAPYFKKSVYHQFEIPTCDTRIILSAISAALPQLYKSGTRYYKCGVGLVDLHDSQYQQQDLFAVSQDDPGLMKMLDSINSRYGRHTLQFASRGIEQKFDMKREFLSKRATTRWRDIPRVVC